MNILFFRLILALIATCYLAADNRLFQVASYQSLSDGEFGGHYSVQELEKEGDFGLGALEGLKGELVIYKGKYLYVDPKGKIKAVKSKNRATFAQVCQFSSKSSFKVKNIRNMKILEKTIQDHLITANAPCAVLIKGSFVYIEARAFKPQKPPYTDLKEANLEQNVYHFAHDSGVVVGFWSPQYWYPVMPNGLHMQFLNENMSRGGHVLDLHIDSAEIFIQPLNEVQIYLPNPEEYSQLEFNKG